MARSGIAIVGMSAAFADCVSPEEFWRNLQDGRESLGHRAKVEPAAVATGSGHWVESDFTDNSDEMFDAGLFGLSPREAQRMDPQQRVFLEACWEALEDGGCSPEAIGARVGVFGGANFSSFYGLSPHHLGPEVLEDMIGADKDYLATRVAHHLGLRGPALTVQTACSTSLVAIHLACQSLLSGECDAALAGGVSITKPRPKRYFYSPGGILSPDGYCRAFDAEAMGTVFTEGVGVVALMRLNDAVKGAHPIYAVIRGSAVNNDGGGKTSFMAPSIAGQERVIREALKAAKVEPQNIGYVEGHGTATVLGDAIELAALTRVFRDRTDKVGFCHLGSVKTNIGHTVSAAGVAGLIKAALVLKHEMVPPNVNFETANPDLDFETSPFVVSAEPHAWRREDRSARYAAVSSFGVGGTNAHVVLEEAPLRARGRARRSHYVLTLSAASDMALAAAAERLHDRLKGASRSELADLAYTLNVGRRALGHRAAIVCADVREARDALAGRAQSTAFSGRIPTGSRSIGFMFPGQGSQHVGMGRELYAGEPLFRETIDRCLAVLRDAHGLDLSSVFHAHAAAPDEAFITRTEIAQPLIFMVEYALGALMISWGITPGYAIGHSVGEFAAAALAGVFRLEDALGLVVLRGRLMQSMAPGAMLSIAAPPETVAPLLPDDLDLAAVNGPRQCVVAGPADRIDAFAAELLTAQIHSMRLRTSHAFHSRMMEPMLADFRRAVEQVQIGPPSFPLISNETGDVAHWEALRDPDYWVRHVRSPVLFAQGLQTLAGRGVDLLLEIGPGRQLSALAQQCGLHRQGVRIINTMNNDATIAEGSVLMRALSRIWLEGGDVDWKAVHRGENRQMVFAPRYPFEREHFATPAVETATSRWRGKLGVEDWLYLPTWIRTTLPPPEPMEDGRCCVTFEGESLGGRLAAEFEALGCPTVCVRPGEAFSQDGRRFTVRPDAEEDYQALVSALQAENLVPRKVVHAWTLDSAADARANQVLGIHSLSQILKVQGDVYGREPVSFDIVVGGAHEVTGVETLRPEAATVVGFAKAGPQEKVQLSCRLIDVDPALLAPDKLGAACRRLAHAAMSESDKSIALRGDFWWRQEVEAQRVASDPGQMRLRKGGVYLITGGLGHIGMILARRLAEEWSARLVLVGRSPLEEPEGSPSPTRREHLEELAALGAEPVYLQADVSNLEDVRRLRAEVLARFGRLDGLILGAGSVEAAAVADDIDAFEVYADAVNAKVEGVRNAIAVFGEDPLDFSVVLSSISAFLGGMGLSAYAAANHMADLLVLQHRRAGHTAWTTSNWDLWVGGKVDEHHPRMSRFLGLAIKPHEGAQALVNILGLPPLGQVIVSTHDLRGRMDTWIRGLVEATAAPVMQHKRPNLATVYSAVEGELEQKIAKLWTELLGIDPIGRDDDFFEMGGHSLLAVQIAVRISEFMPVDAPTANLYETPTIAALAAALEQREPSASPADAPVEALA